MVLTAEQIDRTVMSVSLVMGLLLLILASQAHRFLDEKCTNKMVRLGLNIIIGLGSALAALGFGYLVCGAKNICYQSADSREGQIYIGVTTIISITILVLSSLIYTNLRKHPDCDQNIRNWVLGIIGVSSLSLVGAIIGVIFTFNIA